MRVADQRERGGRDDGEAAEVSHPAEADIVTDQREEEDMEPDQPHQQLSVEEEAIVLQQPDKVTYYFLLFPASANTYHDMICVDMAHVTRVPCIN